MKVLKEVERTMKVLLAIDGTAQSDAAVNAISSLKLDSVSEIQIFTVIDMALPMAHDIYTGMIVNTVDIEKAANEVAASALESTRTAVEKLVGDMGCMIVTSSEVGSPESKIVEKAEEAGSDLIIMGSHGYNTWERLLLGSVSDSVIHHAPCSVLVVRTNNQA
jgi:nucleotide-binding universal stress UspA family protein